MRRSFVAVAFAVTLAGACTRDMPREPTPSASATPSLAPRAAAPSAVPSSSAAATQEIRYLALGDSFTIGTGSLPEEAFPTRLAERWRARGLKVTLRNVAVNGYTTQDVLDRELPEVASFAPTLVTLAVGANDRVHGSKVEDYRGQVRRILREIVEAGVRADRIVTLPQPDWSRSPAARPYGTPAELATSIEAFNRALREEAETLGAKYVDLFPLMRRQADAGMLAGDHLHPSAKAHDEWSAELDQRLAPP